MNTRRFSLRFIQCLFLFCISFVLHSQTSEPYPYAGDIIKFDMTTNRADKVIPFDKPFVLVVENISTDDILRVSILRVKYEKGNRILFPDRPENISEVDYVFEQKQMIIEKNKLTLLVPALRPSKDFDILIHRKLSGRNLERAHALDKIIVDSSLHPGVSGFVSPLYANRALKMLQDSANNNKFIPARDVFRIDNVTQYYNEIYSKYDSNYRKITVDSNYATVASGFVFLTPAELNSIAVQGTSNARPFNDVFLLAQINREGTINDILLGLRAINNSHGSSLTEKDDFDKRVANLSASVQLFDSLYRTMNEIAAKYPQYDSTRNAVLRILNTLQANKKVITDNTKAINNVLTKRKESLWLIGTTHSKDLQTKSSSIFTLDAGFANLWARSLDNKNVYIPKLYWGVNIYFRGTDKNLRSRYIPKKKSPARVASGVDSIYCDYDVLSHKTPFTHLCLTIGFTFGSLDKENFDNFFAGSSMLVGPSLRLTRSFRVSVGAVFLKRNNLNPILSDKRITVGAYTSVSLDFDILNALKNVPGLFFK